MAINANGKGGGTIKKTVKIKDTDYELNSKLVSRAILDSKEKQDIDLHVNATRQLLNPSQEVRGFVKEIANDVEYAEVIAIKHTEKEFIKAVYERTDLSRAETLYLFGLNASTFQTWRREEKWVKKTTKKKLDKERLITILFHGEYSVLEVKKENEEDLKKKYNAIYFKVAKMVEGVIAETFPDKYILETYEKAINLIDKCQKGQFEAKNLAPTIKERTDMRNKDKELELKEREVAALEKANDITIVSNNKLNEENMFSPEEMAMIFKRVISENGLDEDIESSLVKKLEQMTGKK